MSTEDVEQRGKGEKGTAITRDFRQMWASVRKGRDEKYSIQTFSWFCSRKIIHIVRLKSPKQKLVRKWNKLPYFPIDEHTI
jgi:hypothetical protein